MSRKLKAPFLIALLLSGLIARAQQDNLPLYALPDARAYRVYASGSMALSRDGRTLVAANSLNNTASIVDTRRVELLAEIPVGKDPRSVALTFDQTRALVVNRGDGTLTVIDLLAQSKLATYPVGTLPYAVVTDNDRTAYVSVQANDEVIRLDLASGAILERYAVPDSPAGLTLWGDFLYVTHLWSGQFTLVYLPQQKVARSIATGLDTTLSQSIEIDPGAGIAYLPQSRSNAANPYLTYDSTVWPVVNLVDLRTMEVLRSRRITPDTADRPVNMPFAAALDRNRRALYVVNAGSDDVSVLDLTTGLARGHVEVRSNPRDGLLSADGGLLYVHNALDGTVAVVDTTRLRVNDVLPISNLSIPVDILLGAELFHRADSRLSAGRWISCANCHFDGQSDGRVWAGFPDGPRNTPVLYDLPNTAPYNWGGTWDELADVEYKIRSVMAGTGLIDGALNQPDGDPHAGLSPDMDVLVAYLATLQGPSNPTQTDSTLVEQGAAVYDDQGCAECHAGDNRTDLLRHDVGTGSEYDTPSLRWLWMSAPYLHNGSAATLGDVFALPGEHQLIGTLPAEEIDALVAYLLSL